MANYNLAFYKKNQFTQIDLNIPKKVKNIDEYTTEFVDEKELKLDLLNKNLISKEDINSKIYIIYNYNKEIKKLNIIYRNQKKYLDEQYLRNKIQSLKSDFTFLEKLANHYSTGSAKYNPQLLNVSDIRNYLGYVRTTGIHSSEVQDMLNKALNDLFIKAIGELDRNSGEFKYNYRGLRDLARFVFRYIETKKLEELKTQIKEEVKIEKKEEIKREFKPYIGEQLNFFDNPPILEEDIDDYEEPLFPPNSEEEKMYNDYEAKLRDLSGDSELYKKGEDCFKKIK